MNNIRWWILLYYQIIVGKFNINVFNNVETINIIIEEIK